MYEEKDSIFRLGCIPRFLCCLMFASWPPGPASSPARPCPVFFAALLAPPPALASPGPSRPLHPAGAAAAAASCELRPQTSRKNLSRLATQGRPDQPSTSARAGAEISEEKGNDKYLTFNLIFIKKNI